MPIFYKRNIILISAILLKRVDLVHQLVPYQFIMLAHSLARGFIEILILPLEKPGKKCDVIENPEADCTKGSAVDECQNDFDCHGTGKCCKGKDGCSRTCIYTESGM